VNGAIIPAGLEHALQPGDEVDVSNEDDLCIENGVSFLKTFMVVEKSLYMTQSIVSVFI
jgi:hypothetical protein